jgi:hypothetical protein
MKKLLGGSDSLDHRYPVERRPENFSVKTFSAGCAASPLER